MKNFFKFYDIRIRQLFYISLIFLFYLVFDLFVISPFFLDLELKREISLQKDILFSFAKYVEDYLLSSIQELKRFSEAKEFKSGRLDLINKHLAEFNRVTNFFDDIFLVTEDGIWLSFPNSPELVGKKLRTDEWLKATLNSNHEYIADLILSGRRGFPVLGISLVIKDGYYNSKRIVIRGVFRITIDSKLSKIIKEFKFGKDGYIYLVGKDGYLLADNFQDNKLAKDYSKREPVKSLLISFDKDFEYLEYKNDSEVYCALAKRIKITDWILVLEQPKKEVIRKVKFNEVIFRVFVLIIILLFSIITLLSVQYPLIAITRFLDILKNKKRFLLKRKPRDQIEEVIFSISELFNELYSSKEEIASVMEKYKAILDNSSDWIWEIDKNGTFIFTSQTIEAMLGHKVEEVIGNKFWDFIIDEEKVKIREEFKKIIEERIPLINLKNVFIHKSGHKVIFETKATAFFSDDGTIAGFRGVTRDITESYSYLKALERALNEKEVLIAEIQHRIKNNLNTISSIIQLQRDYIKDEKISQILTDTINRINAISFIHQKIYSLQNIANISLREIFEVVIQNILISFNKNEKVTYELLVEDIKLEVNKVLPCVLILNEFVTNSLKYAFNENLSKEAKIIIYFNYQDGFYTLKVSDNGIGTSEENLFDLNTMGMKLIKELVSQLNGKIEFFTNNGFTVEVSFK